MAPKKPSTGVPYLKFEKGKYYVYRRPEYIKEKGLEFRFPVGTTLAEAKKHAIRANAEYDRLISNCITGEHPESLAYLIQKFEKEWVPTKKYAEGTLSNLKNRLNKITIDKGSRPARSISVKELNDWLDQNFVNNARVKHRQTLVEIYRFGLGVGIIPSSVGNIAEMTLKRPEKESEVIPIVEDQFYTIRSQSPLWLQNAMNICLITLQDETVISKLRHDHCRNGRIELTRSKTSHKLSIGICEAMEHVLAQSRRSGIASPYVVHRIPERIPKKLPKKKGHITQVLPKYISNEFSKIRDKLGICKGLRKEQKFGFYSIKSLGGKMYLDQGHSLKYVKDLMGHEEESTTEIYTDKYESFEKVEAGLKVNF